MTRSSAPRFASGFGSTRVTWFLAVASLSLITPALAAPTFTLIDADQDQAIAGFDPIPAGATINLAQLPTRNLSVRANPDPGAIGSMRFVHAGIPSFTWVEDVAPYALAGDLGGDYLPWRPSLGSHRITATPFSRPRARGSAGASGTVRFTVIDQALAVTGFTLINADTDRPVPGYDPIRAGAVLNLATLPTRRLSVRANAVGAASVRFGLDGNASYRLESVAPFALSGDTNGDYFPWTPVVGSVQVSARPYSQAGGRGMRGSLRSLVLRVIDRASSALSFTLINADTDQPVPGFDPLRSGTVLDLKAIGTRNLNVRANVPGTTPGSVRFTFDGKQSVENVAPFALAGDNAGDYLALTPSLGGHRLGAAAYARAGAAGPAGLSATISFRVTDTKTPPAPGTPGGQVTGTLRAWHRVSVSFRGPLTSEGATPNPFLFYRLSVTFSGPGGESFVVPGFFAGDGRAADTSATRGDTWRVHFAPSRAGRWTYRASFRQGTNLAINRNPNAGTATSFNGATGSFLVAASDKSGRDLRGKGLLKYVGKHHLQFAGSKEYFLKAGADSPENFLGYFEFDNTRDLGGVATPGLINGLHRYAPHLRDSKPSDPSWAGGKGRGIMGALNYLSSRGGNSLYFLTYNTDGGDGRDTWPWVSPTQRQRFDLSKLAQWEVVFSHMDQLGIQLHVVTQENENDRALDGGALGTTRKLYYRELVARFGHHLAVIWNLGEENRNSTTQKRQFAAEIRALDPYDHPITVHTFFDQASTYYNGILGNPGFEATSIQGKGDRYNAWAIELRRRSKAAGRPWAIYGDEQGPAVAANLSNLDVLRKESLYGNLMGGGAGVEWYFGYQGTFGDVQSEDWSGVEPLWNQTRYATEFFQQNLPFADMEPRNDLVSGAGTLGLAKVGSVYAVYLENAATAATLNLTAGNYTVRWFNPEQGGALQGGTVRTLRGPGVVSLGRPPAGFDDALCLVRSTSATPAPTPGKVAQGQNGRLVLEAEAAALAGMWRKTTISGREGVLYAGADSFARPPAGQTLSYSLRPDQSGTWSMALHSSRENSLIPGFRFDLGNDAWIQVTDVASGNVIRTPVKLYTDFGNANRVWRWGRTFDFNSSKVPAQLALTAGRTYRLDVIGRSRGYVIDRITLRRGTAPLLDTNAPPSPLR